jgi:ornithine cyclodeaminase
MRFIDPEQTRGVISLERAAAIVRETYALIDTEAIEVSTPSSMPLGQGPERFRAKGATLRRRGVVGARLSSPGHSMLILWDLQSGEPLVLMDEEWLYRRRTGVSGAVIAQWLRPDGPPPSVALIGAGPIAEQCAIALAALVKPSQLRIAARSLASAGKLRDALHATQMPCVPCATVQEAVAGADIVLTITTAKSPVVELEWIKPGAAIISMGGGCEFGFEFWQAARHRLVDDLDYACTQGDIADWISRGHTSREQVGAEITQGIGDLGRSGGIASRRAGELVFAVVQGATALDLAIGHELFEATGGAAPLA